jgi:hypothetical protein
MKRSKLFLGITTGLLAVAGIAAAKTTWNTTRKTGYYTNAAGTACILNGGSFYTQPGTGSLTAKNGTLKLHTISNPFGDCTGHLLYTKDDE